MSQRVRLAAWILLTATVLLMVVLPHRTAISTSFPGYWVVGRLVLSGVDGVTLYDDVWLAAQLATEGFPGDRMLGPPSLALTLLPLAWLPYETARGIFLIAVLTPALLGSLWWLSRRFSPGHGLAFAVAFALSRPTEAGMEVAQIYPVMLALHCAGLWGWERDRPALGGLALAPMMAIRGWHGLPNAAGWLIAGRWRGWLWASVGTVGLIGLSVPILGVAAWRFFFTTHLSQAVGAQTAYSLAYQTWRSLALHLTTFHPVFSPDPPLLGLGSALWLVGAAVIGVVSLWAGHRLGRRASGFALWTAVALLLAPFAEDHQYVLAALPAAVAWAEVPRARPVVLAALALLLPDWSFDRPELLGGWRALLAYPRVYGIGLLWLILVSAPADAPSPSTAPS
ncbi:MAG: hypothetical protein ACI8RZ_004441 [Myxococcota bacterium]